MKIMVSVGTHEQPYQRLLDMAQECAVDIANTSWIVQYGLGEWKSGSNTIAAEPYFDSNLMRQHLAWADVLVSQASPGNAFAALGNGTWPLVLGRSASLNEHVDDHQVHFAAKLHQMGKATNIKSPDNLKSLLLKEANRTGSERLSKISQALNETDRNARRFRTDVWALIEGLN